MNPGSTSMSGFHPKRPSSKRSCSTARVQRIDSVEMLKPKLLSTVETNGTRNGASTYTPISSVWEGSDGELLELMFKFYGVIPPEPILDATYNAGRFWKSSKREVVSMDIDPQYKT